VIVRPVNLFISVTQSAWALCRSCRVIVSSRAEIKESIGGICICRRDYESSRQNMTQISSTKYAPNIRSRRMRNKSTAIWIHAIQEENASHVLYLHIPEPDELKLPQDRGTQLPLVCNTLVSPTHRTEIRVLVSRSVSVNIPRNFSKPYPIPRLVYEVLKRTAQLRSWMKLGPQRRESSSLTNISMISLNPVQQKVPNQDLLYSKGWFPGYYDPTSPC